MRVKNVGHRPVWVDGILIMPGEIKEIDVKPEEIEGLTLSIISKTDFEILEALQDVGKELAEALLEKFDTLERIKRASVKELMEIPGIDRKRALRIRKQLKR